METTTNTTSYFLNADSNVVTTGTVVPSSATSTNAAAGGCNIRANCYNAPTNVPMTLADARSELESNGFVILEQHESEHFLSSNKLLVVGCRSECRWYSLGKMDTLVFVQELTSNADPLTVHRIQEDVQRLQTDWLLSLPAGFYSPDGCPPHGTSRARLIVLVYLSPHQPISPEVALYLTQKPPGEWCQLTLLAAQDVTNSNGAGDSRVTSYFYSLETPMWGRAFYPEVRYWAALLTGRRPLPDKPSPYNLCLIAIQIYCIALLYVMHPPNTPSGRKFWCMALAILPALFLVAFVYHAWLKRRFHAITNNNNNNTMNNSTGGGGQTTTTIGNSLV